MAPRGYVTRVLEAVRPLGYTFVALPMVFGEGTPSERHVQRVSKVVDKDHLPLDLLVAERALAGVLDDRVQLSLPEGPLAVVSRATLIRMKELADRDQDRADLAALEAGDGA
jgi:hypothetical protein